MSSRTRKKRHTGRNILITLLVILAIIVGGLFLIFRHFYSKSNFMDDKKVRAAAAEEYAKLDQETRSVIEATGLTESEEAELKESLAATQTESQKTEIPTKDNIYTVLLVLENGGDGQEDVYMIGSLNRTKNKVTAIQMDENLAVNVEGYGIKKLSAAYKIGKGPMLVSTIESNFDIRIDNYACVDVKGVEQGMEELGDVELNVADINRAVNKLMTYVSHNIPTTKLLSLVNEVPGLITSELQQQEGNLPMDGLYSAQGEVLVPKQPETNQQIRELLYGVE